jgi:hypothetical protein
MTLIAGYKFKSTNGEGIVIAGDSRVVKKTKTQKLVSQTDLAQKVSILLPNVIIGLAGDYKYIDLYKTIEEEINRIDDYGKKVLEQDATKLAKVIAGVISDNFSPNRLETDFIIGIIDSSTKKQMLYKYETDFNNIKKLDEGLHIIGEDEKTRERFKELFNSQLQTYLEQAYNNYKIVDGNYFAPPLLIAFDELLKSQPQNVGGVIQCYATTVYGWACVCNTKFYWDDNSDNQVTLVSDTVDGLRWKRQINQNNKITDINRTITDYEIIHEKLNKEVKT